MTEPTPETPVEEFSVSGENLADKVKETAEKVKDAFSCDGDYAAQEEKLEEQLGGISEEIKCDGHGLVDAVKGIIDAGNARRITIKNEQGDEIITFPLTAGAVGVVIAPLLAAVGAVAALVAKCTIVVERVK